jgi:hypothetical protein
MLRRNGAEMQKGFLTEWIPRETLYFDKTGSAARCTMRIS